MLTPCALWSESVDRKGYGQKRWGGRLWKAHRLAYTLLVGPIPDGHDIHHRCQVKRCCNPDHLQPLSVAEHLGLRCKGDRPMTAAERQRALRARRRRVAGV